MQASPGDIFSEKTRKNSVPVRVEALEDADGMRPLGAKQVFAPAEGPADLLNAPEAAAEPRREAIAVFIFVGDEVRSGEEV